MIPFVDLHCDTLSKLCSRPADFFLPQAQARSHITLSGLCTSGALLQCFALFTDLAECTDSPPLTCIGHQLDCYRLILAASDNALAPVLTYTDILKNRQNGRISTLLSLEESCLTDNPAALLSGLYAGGVRMATFTWNHSNLLGFPASLSPFFAHKLPLNVSGNALPGLTPAGFDFLSEAERLGIILDVSHLSDAGFYDVAAHSTKPFLASHSNARAVCNVPRNLSDDMLHTLGEHGGVVGLNLHEPFLVNTPASADDLLVALIRHATHIRSIAGSDALALGTDFDGIPGNAAIPNVAHLPRLENALKKAGLTSGEIEKIFYRNALRVFKECLS